MAADAEEPGMSCAPFRFNKMLLERALGDIMALGGRGRQEEMACFLPTLIFRPMIFEARPAGEKMARREFESLHTYVRKSLSVIVSIHCLWEGNSLTSSIIVPVATLD